MKELFAQLCNTARKFFYGSSLRKEAEYILQQLREEPTRLDFLCFRWTSLNQRDTVCIIQRAIENGIVTWDELHTSAEQVHALYEKQFSNLMSLYELSFRLNFWHSYSHAAQGLRSFYNIAYGPNEDLLSRSVFCSIKRHFAEVIYDFLRTEGPSPEIQVIPLGDEEATLTLIHTHHYCEEELWIVRRPSTVTSSKAAFKKIRA